MDVLYKALRHAGVMVELQLEGTVAKEPGPTSLEATLISSSIGLTSGCKKLVVLILRIVLKYVVGDTRPICPWRTRGRLYEVVRTTYSSVSEWR